MGDWSSGLFECFNDMTICLLAWCVPCFIQGKIAETVGESCILHGILCLIPPLDWICAATIRGKVRENKGIEGSFMGDCCVIMCCAGCALAQEGREMNAMGISRE
ncbi:uncharacterized protein LOC142341136 [Convolutriloba macropyga]|uniref:uncharacterized protein LOC142341136 n=1 Tax=Convolutriloba macropyga TaxID=536237 RepID=UPI003F51B96B